MADSIIYDVVRYSTVIEIPVLVLLHVTIASLIVGQGEAINCFVCNSKWDPRCADPIQTGLDSDEDSEQNKGALEPVECHLARKYTAGIQAVSEILRGFGQPRLKAPDIWISTAMTLDASSGQGSSYGSGTSTANGGSIYGNRPYPRGGNRGSIWPNSNGVLQEQDEPMGCHKVDYIENGEALVDRGCAPYQVANKDPCSALEQVALGSDGGGSGNTGSSGGSSGYGGIGGSSGFGGSGGNSGFGGSGGNSGYGGSGGFGSSSGGRNSGSGFDVTLISAEFCEICSDEDGCNGASRLSTASIVSVLILVLVFKWCVSLS